MKTATVVTSFDGLWDEQAKAESHNIGNRTNRCRGVFTHHTFINASLCWEVDRSNFKRWPNCLHGRETTCVSVDIAGPGPGSGGYGWIRFCVRCKEIDCIHYWKSNTNYVIRHSRWYDTCAQISLCVHCGRRILISSWGSSHADNEAFALIDEVCRKLNRPTVSSQSGIGVSVAPGLLVPQGAYGSAWSIELPVKVSELLATEGRDAAERFVSTCLTQGLRESGLRL